MALTYVLTGAHSTGKTTLIEALKAVIVTDNTPLYKFSISSTRSSGADTSLNATDEDQLQILSTIIEYEKQHNLYQDHFILDRSFIDFFVYTTYLYRAGNISTETFEIIKKEFKLRIPLYTDVFLLMPEFGVVSDGVRVTTPQYQLDIHNIIVEILSEYDIQYHELVGDTPTRANAVLNAIPQFKKYNRSDLIESLKSFDDNLGYIIDGNIAVCHNGKVVSFLSYACNDNKVKIGYIYTDRNYRHQHLARYLVGKLVDMYAGNVFYLYIKEQALPFYKNLNIDKHIKGESTFSGIERNFFCIFSHDTSTGEFVDYSLDQFVDERLKCL